MREKVEAVRARYAKVAGLQTATSDAASISRPINTADIIKSVATVFRLERSQLFSESRIEGIRIPRQIATYIIREHLDRSYQSIGRLFGQDHATVLRNCEKIRRALQVPGPIRNAVEEVLAQLR